MTSRQRKKSPAPRIRQYRRSASLAQRELALLVGLATQHACSELETGSKRPGLDVALACAIALGVPADVLFPELISGITRDVLIRAEELRDLLKIDGGRVRSAAYLTTLIDRLNNSAAS